MSLCLPEAARWPAPPSAPRPPRGAAASAPQSAGGQLGPEKLAKCAAELYASDLLSAQPTRHFFLWRPASHRASRPARCLSWRRLLLPQPGPRQAPIAHQRGLMAGRLAIGAPAGSQKAECCFTRTQASKARPPRRLKPLKVLASHCQPA